MTEKSVRGSDERSELSASTYTVDSFANGIAFGQHRLPQGEDPRDHYNLQVEDDAGMVRLRSRYALNKTNPFHELERHLMRLSTQGTLRSSTIYFGTTTDPFLPFEDKFDASMKFLELFKRYTPGLLVVQTRSPLVVIAMPVLSKLGKHCAVTMGLETPLEEAVRRYTPGLPRVEERLKTVRALRNFGVEVTLQVSPLLPYGDWKKDAAPFASLLIENGDYVHIRPLTDGKEQTERRVRGTALAKRLAEDRKFHWLRPDTANPLITAVEVLAPQKLRMPQRSVLASRQVNLFGT